MSLNPASPHALPEIGLARPRARDRLSLRWSLAIIGGASALLWLGIAQVAALLAG
ncbi:hypothetical protein [Falsiroseomonas tokyonensis]|uniref:Uncharacterized protein n=1 Tax=Falsiroseomonas tokyonensis TaxID=430521 RepID=A0ABV7BVP5_9PROT|nr:hypothetical protein [Falsiroseomonas tokyonensis]MBU8539727.1 hypothetical protein [Falsiroseomonas tokyonensis]